MSKIIDVWFSFGMTLEVEDAEDYAEIARKGRPELIDRINSDSIQENIEEVNIIEDE